MSRSYKKHPVVNDGHVRTTKEKKRCANSIVRKYNEDQTFNGGSYKKIFCSYDIHDYVSRQTIKDYIVKWNEEEAEIINGKWTGKEKYLLHNKYKNIENYIN